MICIEADGYGGYKVKVSEPGTGSRGYSVHANDYKEAIRAVEHYYHKPYHDWKKPPKNCPFCRRMKEEGGKR